MAAVKPTDYAVRSSFVEKKILNLGLCQMLSQISCRSPKPREHAYNCTIFGNSLHHMSITAHTTAQMFEH